MRLSSCNDRCWRHQCDIKRRARVLGRDSRSLSGQSISSVRVHVIVLACRHGYFVRSRQSKVLLFCCASHCPLASHLVFAVSDRGQGRGEEGRDQERQCARCHCGQAPQARSITAPGQSGAAPGNPACSGEGHRPGAQAHGQQACTSVGGVCSCYCG